MKRIWPIIAGGATLIGVFAAGHGIGNSRNGASESSLSQQRLEIAELEDEKDVLAELSDKYKNSSILCADRLEELESKHQKLLSAHDAMESENQDCGLLGGALDDYKVSDEKNQAAIEAYRKERSKLEMKVSRFESSLEQEKEKNLRLASALQEAASCQLETGGQREKLQCFCKKLQKWQRFEWYSYSDCVENL